MYSVYYNICSKEKSKKKHFSVSSLLYRHEKIKMEIKIDRKILNIWPLVRGKTFENM